LTQCKTHVTGRDGQLILTRDNVRIKIVIIRILKSDSRISLGHGLGGSTRVDLGQRTIKVIIIIILKLNLEVDLRQDIFMGREGQLGLTQVNIWIKIIIIIILKPDLGVDPG
jgi:hypothetical protein